MVSLKFCIKGGSSSEKAGQKGAAHFLAKSAFVGTSEASGLKMVRFMESIGASFGAYADKEKVRTPAGPDQYCHCTSWAPT
jgi:predicted Zn-dependent peptidase